MIERIFEAQNRAFSLLEAKNLDTGSVRLLMEYVTGLSGASLLMNYREPLKAEQHTLFWDKVKELETGKPIQYVIGKESFFGRIFEVNSNVLIPRPETEELLYNALEKGRRLFEKKEIAMADIGTGSGAIAITFKKEWPEAEVTATDISKEALAIAIKNAANNEATITFKEGDLTAPIANQKWDIVLSNPPYIAFEEAAEMSDTVLSYEPHQALFAEEDGLYFYRRLAESLPQLMNKPALIGIEIGYQQAEVVHKLFEDSFPNARVETVKDINGKDRMIFCEISE